MRQGTAQLNKHRGKLKVREADHPYLKTLLLPLVVRLKLLLHRHQGLTWKHQYLSERHRVKPIK
jgi:hypothetical protein